MARRSVGARRPATALTLLLLALSPVPPVAAGDGAPVGFRLMCLKTPAECRGGGQSSIAASAPVLRLLRRVNAAVNAAIVPRSDGARDEWKVGASAGDCEDYVLAKRRALIDAGLDASALRFAYVKTAAGEGHAILVVRTSEGDLVLDSLDARIRPLEASGYRLVSMSGANPRIWN